MSIVAMKRKAELVGNLSHKGTFSINGGRRNIGYIGQTSLGRSLIHTPYRNGAPINYGGKNWNPAHVQIITPSNMLYLEDTSKIKTSTLSNIGKLETRVDQHPIVDKSNTVSLTYQSNFIERLSKKTVIDINRCTNDGLYYDTSFNIIESVLVTPSAGIPSTYDSIGNNALNFNVAGIVPFTNTNGLTVAYKQFAYVLDSNKTVLYYTDFITGTISTVDLTTISNLSGIISAGYSLYAIYPVMRSYSSIQAVLLFINSLGYGKIVVLNGDPNVSASYSQPTTGSVNFSLYTTDYKNVYFWYKDSSNYLFYVNSVTASSRTVIKTSLDLLTQSITSVGGNDTTVLPTIKFDYTGRMIIMESDGTGIVNMKQVYYSAGTLYNGTNYNFKNELGPTGANVVSFSGNAYLLGEVYFDNTYSASGKINMYFVLGDSGSSYQPYFIKWTVSNNGSIDTNSHVLINSYTSVVGAITDVYQPYVLSYTAPDINGDGSTLEYLLMRVSGNGTKTVQTFYANGPISNTSFAIQYYFTSYNTPPSDLDIIRLSNRIQFILKSSTGAYLGIYEINKNTYTEKRAYADARQNTCRGQLMAAVKNTYLFSRLKRMTDTTIVKPDALISAIPSSEYMYNLNKRMVCCITTDQEFVDDRKAPTASRPVNTC